MNQAAHFNAQDIPGREAGRGSEGRNGRIEKTTLGLVQIPIYGVLGFEETSIAGFCTAVGGVESDFGVMTRQAPPQKGG